MYCDFGDLSGSLLRAEWCCGVFKIARTASLRARRHRIGELCRLFSRACGLPSEMACPRRRTGSQAQPRAVEISRRLYDSAAIAARGWKQGRRAGRLSSSMNAVKSTILSRFRQARTIAGCAWMLRRMGTLALCTIFARDGGFTHLCSSNREAERREQDACGSKRGSGSGCGEIARYAAHIQRARDGDA